MITTWIQQLGLKEKTWGIIRLARKVVRVSDSRHSQASMQTCQLLKFVTFPESSLLSANTGDGEQSNLTKLSSLRAYFIGTPWLRERYSCLTKWRQSRSHVSHKARFICIEMSCHTRDNGLLLHFVDLHSFTAHVTLATAKSVWINFSSIASWDNASDVLIKFRQAAAIAVLSCTN